MNNIIASTLYLKSNGRVCSFCKGIINHRRPFRAQGKMTFHENIQICESKWLLANRVTNGLSFTMDMT
jgi:hypothetical protein